MTFFAAGESPFGIRSYGSILMLKRWLADSLRQISCAVIYCPHFLVFSRQSQIVKYDFHQAETNCYLRTSLWPFAIT